MTRFVQITLLWCACVATAEASPLRRVRLDVEEGRALATRLELAGFDVLEGSVTDNSLELVVSEADLQSLIELGFDPVTLAIGRPFKDIQEEQAEDSIPTGYPDLPGIIDHMTSSAATYPTICRMVDLTATYGTPTTYEGRHMYAVKISDNVNLDEDEPAVLIVADFHAREIVTPVIALYALDRFTTQYGVDPTITDLVNNNEIWIAPTWNPDGYNYVYNTDNMWRKNRRVFATGIGVDINRNFPIGWDTTCAGDSDPASETYKGPSAGSEAETQTLVAWSNDRHFSRIIDYHSSGREVVRDYVCLTHPFRSYHISEASALSVASGYGGSNRDPSAEGEHYEWQLAFMGGAANLIETALDFQPTYSAAQAEAVMVWPGIIWAMQRTAPLWGYVTDAVTGEPVEALISYVGVNFSNGEVNPTGRFGRYNAYVPAGTYTLALTAPGYEAQTIPNVSVTTTPTRLDIAMAPPPALTFPNGGEQLPVNVPTTVTWNNANPAWQYHVQATYNYGQIGTITDNFERASLGTDYTTGGALPWDISYQFALLGTRSAKAGQITHNQSSWMTRTGGAGSLSFWYLVRSEANGDFFNFYIDGTQMVHASGVGGGWTQYATTLGPGLHELKWEYTKNGSGSQLPDSVWVDYLQMVADNTTWTDVTALTPLGASSTAWTPATQSTNGKVRIQSYHPADSTYGPWGESAAVFSVVQIVIRPGDLNCDSSVSFGDINPFVQILTDLAGWQAAHPGCPWQNGDINADGSVNFGDINPFVALLTGPP
jgi:murein tripeptide amidase MpaA